MGRSPSRSQDPRPARSPMTVARNASVVTLLLAVAATLATFVVVVIVLARA